MEAEKQYRLKAGNLGVYTEIALWTLRGPVAASRFQQVMQMIVDDDRQAEAYFQVFKLPQNHGIQLNAAESPQSSADGLNQHFLVVSIGSCDQLVELHQLYDIRAMINGFSGHMENKARSVSTSINENIRQFSSRVYCLRASHEMKAIVGEWCSYPNFHISLCETVQATVPGGWYVPATVPIPCVKSTHTIPIKPPTSAAAVLIIIATRSCPQEIPSLHFGCCCYRQVFCRQVCRELVSRARSGCGSVQCSGR